VINFGYQEEYSQRILLFTLGAWYSTWYNRILWSHCYTIHGVKNDPTNFFFFKKTL